KTNARPAVKTRRQLQPYEEVWGHCLQSIHETCYVCSGTRRHTCKTAPGVRVQGLEQYLSPAFWQNMFSSVLQHHPLSVILFWNQRIQNGIKGPSSTISGGGTGTTSSGGGTGTTSSGGGTGTTSSGGTTPSPCLPSKYRNVEGLCGNPSAPSWGRANEPFARLVSSFYADGISSAAVMSNGAAYANVRNISFFLFGIDEPTDTTRTMLNIFFLQAITNDLADTSSSTSNACCINGQVVSPGPVSCYPVVIPDDDPLYSWFNIKCLEYSRVNTAPQTDPPQAVRQINRATSYLDLSFLYGTSSVQNPSRLTTGGRLLSVSRNGLEFPVLDPAGCTSPLQDVCYLVADSRSYQSPMSAIVHLLFFREHNRLALQLKNLNPSWSDLTLYEEARRINIAQYQRIVYYELLPRFLGRTNMVNERLIYESTGFVNDYDASQNPSSIA
uniref:Uncharacterized protein n=1 Tax=Anopheles albimanus TaxID=7167 RepID=A0A182FVJ4_ANOAL